MLSFKNSEVIGEKENGSVVSKPMLRSTLVHESGVVPTVTGLTLVRNSGLEKMTSSLGWSKGTGDYRAAGINSLTQNHGW